jgi:hypothetical protein
MGAKSGPRNQRDLREGRVVAVDVSIGSKRLTDRRIGNRRRDDQSGEMQARRR